MTYRDSDRMDISITPSAPSAFALFSLSLAIVFLFSSCTDLKAALDKRGLRDIERFLQKNTAQKTSPESLKVFLRDFRISAEPLVAANHIVREPFIRWTVRPSQAGGAVTAERLSFPSTLIRDNGTPDTAYFYLFHRGPLARGRAILWAPGFGVSDFAFRFIRKFFEEELSQGWAVLVWVPPYHLERQGPDAEAGEGLITLDPRDLLLNVSASVSELATGAAWLKAQGVSEIGAWGGSFGAANLLLLGETLSFDHMSLMIPLVDWRALWRSPVLEPARTLFAKNGYPDSLMEVALSLISPVSRVPVTPAKHIQFLYARHDQLTPEKVLLDYGNSLGEVEVHGFDESHGTILLNRGVYRAYKDFLQRMKTGE